MSDFIKGLGVIFDETTDKIAANPKVRKAVRYYDAFWDLTGESAVRIIRDIPNIPDKTAEKLIETVEEISKNPEATIILCLAAVGTTFIIGRVVMKIPLPPGLEAKMLAPVVGCAIVILTMKSAERRAANAV